MYFKVQGHKKDTMLFGLPSLMLKSTKKKFSSFTAYWWWSKSLHLSRFHEYSWKKVFIIFNPTARKEKNLKCLEVHGKLKRSQRHENRKLTKDAYTHMYYRDWWNSLHESLKEPVKLQYELLVNKRISCRSVAPGLKKKLGWMTWESVRLIQTGSYIPAATSKCKTGCVGITMLHQEKFRLAEYHGFIFFFTQMWHNYISNVLLAQNDKGSLDIIKHLIVYIV